jgi:ABC-type microcin C transport system permease subunit YejB
VFRNAMLLVVAGIPQALIRCFRRLAADRSDLLLDGLGRMSYEAAVSATTRWCSARCSSSPCSAC